MAWHPFRNVGLKLAALALGTLLWVTVSGQQVERRVSIPVFYRDLPASLEITGDSLDAVTVQIRGGDNVIGALRPGNDLFLKVDLTDARPGQNVLPLRTDQVSAALGIQVMQVDPGSVTLTLERTGTANLPIRAALEGEPQAGFVVTSVTVDPQTVEVAGPESRLRGVASAVTERVSVDGRAATFTQDVSVGVADPQLRLRQARTAHVTVRVEATSAGNRMIEGIPVDVRGVSGGRQATTEPTSVAVVLHGSAAALKTIDVSKLAPFVDVAGRAAGSYNLPVHLDLPSGLTLATFTPATVVVRVR